MLLHEFRYTLRVLRRNWGFALGIVLCLALGMGATTAIFTVVNAAQIKALPFAEADRVVVLYDTQSSPDGTVREYRVSPPNFVAWREQSQTFEQVAAAGTRNVNLIGDGEPELLRAAGVTANYFATIGVEPILGRTFSSDEDRLGEPAPVVVLSHRLWQRRFGGDPSILDRSIILDDQGFTVIGVMPPGFGFPEGLEGFPPRELWTPLGLDPDLLPQRRWHNLFVIARLAPGIPTEQARSEMDTIASRLAREFPVSNAGWGVRIRPLRQALVGDEVTSALFLLLVGVGLLLLIACINVASMLLARATTRGSEVALRIALGAGRGRLMRLVLTESVLLALAGSAVGLLMARLSISPLISLSGLVGPAFRDVSIDLRVLGFTLAVAVTTGILFGLSPALKLLDTDLRAVLLEGSSRTGSGRWGQRFRSSLVVAEIALLLVLLVDAGLMVRSFQQLLRVDPGFDTRNLLTMRILLPTSRYPEQHQRITFLEGILAKVRALPGVESATITNVLPIDAVDELARFSVYGRTPEPEEVLVTHHRMIGYDFFKTLDLPVLEGRALNTSDRADSAGVVVVSRYMAQQFWPDQNPLGRQVKRGEPDSDQPWLTIVGVAEDVRDARLDADTGNTWYVPYVQHDSRWFRLVVRTTPDPLSLADAVRQAIWSIDPNQTVYDLATAAELVSGTLARDRFHTVLLSLFASVGLILAVLGIYGVMSYLVNQRTGEIGIRMALGAQAWGVRWMILHQGARLAFLGIGIGLFLSFLVNRLYANLLLDIGATDPLTVAAMAVFLAVVAMLATYLPARRATRVDPADALRSL